MSFSHSSDVNGVDALIKLLTDAAAKVDHLMPLVVEKSAEDLKSLTQRNASLPSSGPPGPRVITGDYVGAWEVHKEPQRDGTSRSVGTNRAQARRLEYGFTGTDSIGRHYDQPPYPHHGPAVDAIEPQFHAAMAEVARKAIGR